MNDTQAIQLLHDMLSIESLSGAESRHAAFLTGQMDDLWLHESLRG